MLYPRKRLCEKRGSQIEVLAEIAVLNALPKHGLMRGQVGMIVEVFSPSAAEVEFCDDQGRTYAIAALRSEELIRLHHQPYEQVA